MYNKENLMAKAIASKSSIKPELGCVAFYGNRTTATDSFRAIEIEAFGEAHEPILYQAKMLSVVKPTKYQQLNHTEFGLVPTEGNYPQIDVIADPAFKKKEEGGYRTIGLNAELLGELLTTMAKAGSKLVEFSVSLKDGEPILITTLKNKKYTANKQQFIKALQMPLNN